MSWLWRNGKSVNDLRRLRRAPSVAGFDGPKILSSIRNFITEVNGLFPVAGATSGEKMDRFGDFGGGRANGSFEITVAVGANRYPGAKVNGSLGGWESLELNLHSPLFHPLLLRTDLSMMAQKDLHLPWCFFRRRRKWLIALPGKVLCRHTKWIFILLWRFLWCHCKRVIARRKRTPTKR